MTNRPGTGKIMVALLRSMAKTLPDMRRLEDTKVIMKQVDGYRND
jgi:hypothetical protein